MYSHGATAGGSQAHDLPDVALSAQSAFRMREASDKLIQMALDIARGLWRAMRRVYGALPRAAGSELLSGHIIVKFDGRTRSMRMSSEDGVQANASVGSEV
jgi:hypothetical protein